MTNAGPEVSQAFAESNKYDDLFRVMPFMTVDGINDAGVICNTNVCPTDKGVTTGTNPDKTDLCQLMMVRFILDNADSALDGVEKLKNYNIFNNLYRINEELHLMVADKNSTYIVEFVDNTISILSDQNDTYPDIPNAPIMTNFHLTDWDGEVKAVYLGDDAQATRATGLEDHAMGLERYKKLFNAYENISDMQSMANAMKSISYTRTYDDTENPVWYSECVGYTETFGELNLYNEAVDFAGIREQMKDDYIHRVRDGKTWLTVHTTVYDIENKHLIIYPQENYSHYYEFDLQTLGESQVLTEEEIRRILSHK